MGQGQPLMVRGIGVHVCAGCGKIHDNLGAFLDCEESHMPTVGGITIKAEIRGQSKLQFGPGSSLWKYWTSGKGFAKWSSAPHKWSTLNKLLKAAGVPKNMVDGLTTNMIEFKFPGYMKQKKGGYGPDGKKK